MAPDHSTPTGCLHHRDHWVSLSPVEQSLAAALLDRFGAVVARDTLAVRAWPDRHCRRATRSTSTCCGCAAGSRRSASRSAPCGPAATSSRAPTGATATRTDATPLALDERRPASSSATIAGCSSASTPEGRSPTRSPTTAASPRSSRRRDDPAMPSRSLAQLSGAQLSGSGSGAVFRHAARARHDGGDERAARTAGRARRTDRDPRASPTSSRSRASIGRRCTTRSSTGPRPSCHASCGSRSRAASTRRRRDRTVGRRAARDRAERRRGRGVPAARRPQRRARSGARRRRCGRRSRRHRVDELSPEFREYERMATTVVNAYLRPACAPVPRAARRPRAGGAGDDLGRWARVGRPKPRRHRRRSCSRARRAGCGRQPSSRRRAGFPDAVTFDMGGTSTDVGLVRGGVPEPAPQRTVAGFPIRLPALDIHTIGAGGGSIARVDAGGALVVGPQSAGLDARARRVTDVVVRNRRSRTRTSCSVASTRDATFPGLGRLDPAAAREALARAGSGRGRCRRGRRCRDGAGCARR